MEGGGLKRAARGLPLSGKNGTVGGAKLKKIKEKKLKSEGYSNFRY